MQLALELRDQIATNCENKVMKYAAILETQTRHRRSMP
jgi:hypothetical protein